MEKRTILIKTVLKYEVQKNNAYRLQPVDIEQQISNLTTNREQVQQESEDFVKENFTMTTNIPEMLGVKETADRFGISQNYARQLALTGAVKAVRIGGRSKILINAQSMADFFNNSYINVPDPVQTGDIKPISVRL